MPKGKSLLLKFRDQRRICLLDTPTSFGGLSINNSFYWNDRNPTLARTQEGWKAYAQVDSARPEQESFGVCEMVQGE